MRKLALISVFDKEGVGSVARALQDMGFELVSTGKTRELLEAEGLKVQDISQLTGEPERFGGRVKTLHHKVLGGILFRPQKDEAEWPYDFRIGAVVCNFYPFEEKAAACETMAELLEWVDVGGPTMVRAAAKNFADVWVITRRDQYARLIGHQPDEADALRARFALQAFQDLKNLDEVIFHNLTWRIQQKTKDGGLRYGENPHQKAFFVPKLQAGLGLFGDLSFNNLRDAEAALKFVKEFPGPAVGVIKHQTLCGAAAGLKTANPLDIFNLAWEGDTVSRFGGILGFNFLPTPEITEILLKKFVEVILIPRSEASFNWALSFREKSPRVRVIEVDIDHLRKTKSWERFEGNLGLLTQEADHLEEVPTQDSESLREAFGFWTAACSKSNAVTLVGWDGARKSAYLAGVGQGQPNRVEAVKKLALPRAQEFCDRMGYQMKDLWGFSDAFLPFEDTLHVLKEGGINILFQPGGSKRDADIAAEAVKLGIQMKIKGRRHFWH